MATNKLILRVYSIGGTILEVLGIPGPLVCLAAHQRTLMVVYHTGMGKWIFRLLVKIINYSILK